MFERFKSLLSSTKSYSLYNSVDRTNFTGFGAGDFLRYNEISLYVNRALDKRAQKVGQIQFKLMKGEGDKVTQIEKNPLLDLLSKPNEYHTGAQFWALWQKHMDIAGCAFILLDSETKLFSDKKIKSMHLLNPSRVKIEWSNEGEITGYIYVNNGTEVKYDVKQVLYSFNPDPANPLKGESLLRAGIRQIDTDVQLADNQNAILKNGGRVEGVFSFKTALTKTQYSELKEAYKDQFSTAKKSGMPLFMGGDASYTNVALTPTELGYLESKKVSLNDICIMTGVPKAVLASIGEETFANADAAHTIFLRETIKPLLESLTLFLDWRLIPEDMWLDFVDPTPEDIDRKIKLITAASTVNAVTTNEKREMLGLDPVKGEEADTILVPFSVQSLDTINEQPEPAPAAKPKEEAKSKALGHHPLRDPFLRKKYGELTYKRLKRREKTIYTAIKTIFAEQEKRVLERLGAAKQFKKKSFIDEMDQHMEIQIVQRSILPLLEQIVKEAGTDVYQLFDTGFDFQLNVALRSWVEDRANVFASDVTATTFKRLQKTFHESIAADETRAQLSKRIEELYDGFSKSRAQTIARTETHGAIQRGTYEAYRQADIPIKIWVHVPGVEGGVRDDHAAIDGEEVPRNQVFSNGLMWPGDASAPPEETINCACSL